MFNLYIWPKNHIFCQIFFFISFFYCFLNMCCAYTFGWILAENFNANFLRVCYWPIIWYVAIFVVFELIFFCLMVVRTVGAKWFHWPQFFDRHTVTGLCLYLFSARTSSRFHLNSKSKMNQKNVCATRQQQNEAFKRNYFNIRIKNFSQIISSISIKWH